MSQPIVPRPRPFGNIVFSPWAILVLVILAHSGSLKAPFIFDDTAGIVRNPTIRVLGSSAIFSPPADGGTTTGRPLVNASFALNYAVSGENPWSYHALNVAIHAAAVLTLLGLVRRTLTHSKFQPTTAAAVVLLWALHPLQTETVACAAQRTESLCALLMLACLYAFARASGPGEHAASRKANRWLVLSAACALLAALTKEVSAVLPLLVLLFDRTFVAGKFSASLRARPFFYAALSGTWLVLALLLARGGGSRGVAAGFGLGVSPWHYLLTSADALALYLKLAVWPHPLILDYGTGLAASLAEVWWQALLVLALLAATLIAICSPRSGHRAIGFLGAAFFLLLAPSTSFVPLVTQTVAEHRMYLPLAALAVLFGLAGQRLLASRAAPLLLLAALALGAATFARHQFYRAPAALWAHDTAVRPHARALTALGVAHLHAGRAAESLAVFQRALAIDPAHAAALRNRALALLSLGRGDEAAALLASLPAREPGEADEFFALGSAYAREQKFAEAAACFARTAALEPARVAAHANLGNCQFALGRIPAAISAYEAALRLRPDDTGLRENLQLARAAAR